jgi:major membrane immunogen (membrane-anchored lipoprotein)
MKRIVLWGMSTLTALVLLFGYHTSTSSQAAVGGQSSAVAPVQGGADATSGSSSSGSSSSGSTSTGSSTVTGDTAATRWGPVQVQLTVADGTITDVSVLQYPSGNGRDQQINARALPVLIQETLDAQNAKIDMVSGATVTSEGYLESLQSALDKAGLS